MSDTARVLRPNRAQLELRPTDLESLVPEDHRARAVWEFVCGLELSEHSPHKLDFLPDNGIYVNFGRPTDSDADSV